MRWCVALVRSVDAYTVPNGRASFSISRVLPGTVPFAFFFSLLLFSIATPAPFLAPVDYFRSTNYVHARSVSLVSDLVVPQPVLLNLSADDYHPLTRQSPWTPRVAEAASLFGKSTTTRETVEGS